MKRNSRLLHRILTLLLMSAPLLQVLAPAFALAADKTPPHEDPATAPSRFDAAAILGFCNDLLDAVLARLPEDAAALAEKAPFANTPDSVKPALAEFTGASLQLGLLVPQLDTDLNDITKLAGQNRLQEVGIQVTKTQATLNLALQELAKLDSDAPVFRQQLGVDSARAGSPLANAFIGMSNGIESIRSLLNMFQALLDGMGAVSNPSNPQHLQQTELTFALDADSAFVGDAVQFHGILTSGPTALAGRIVRILLDGVPYLTAQTAADGSYSGNLQIPYKYVPAISISALYYPQDSDLGVYLASRSQETLFNVLFYSAVLTVDVPAKSYPGLESRINAHFDYGEYPAPIGREAFVYLDGVLIRSIAAGENEEVILAIDPEISPGQHELEVIAPSMVRWAQAEAQAILNVLLAKTTLDVQRPRVTFQPFSFRIRGRASSEPGPLTGAIVEAQYGNGRVAGSTGQDGAFSLSVPNNLTFSLIGTQSLVVKVKSAEPWNDDVTQTWTLVSVNPAMIIFLCALLGLLVFVIRVRRAVSPPDRGSLPDERQSGLSNLESPETGLRTSQVEISTSAQRKPGDENPAWLLYAGVLKLIERRTSQVMADNQTFREFGAKVANSIGPAHEHLGKINLLVEKQYYSEKQLAASDLESLRRLCKAFAEAMPS